MWPSSSCKSVGAWWSSERLVPAFEISRASGAWPDRSRTRLVADPLQSETVFDCEGPSVDTGFPCPLGMRCDRLQGWVGELRKDAASRVKAVVVVLLCINVFEVACDGRISSLQVLPKDHQLPVVLDPTGFFAGVRSACGFSNAATVYPVPASRCDWHSHLCQRQRRRERERERESGGPIPQASKQARERERESVWMKPQFSSSLHVSSPHGEQETKLVCLGTGQDPVSPRLQDWDDKTPRTQK